MGISDREYVRSSGRSYGGGSGGFGWDVIGWLMAVTIVTYILQLLINPGFTSWFELKTSAVLRGQIWRLLTFDFLHSVRSPWHILWNMYLLYMAGSRLLENHTGKEFLLFYLTAGLVAGVSFVLWQIFRGGQAAAVGASGSVAAVLVLYAMYWPRARWTIFYVIPVPVIVIVIVTFVLDLHPVLLELGGGGPSRDGIAHVAHLGGMVYAFAYYRLQWRLEPLVSDVSWSSIRRRFRRRPKLRVHQPAADDGGFELQARMDDLLDKISREGESSLTADERETLNRISRQLRSRKA
jgi:membrane associated rhomboid family serine protease